MLHEIIYVIFLPRDLIECAYFHFNFIYCIYSIKRLPRINAALE